MAECGEGKSKQMDKNDDTVEETDSDSKRSESCEEESEVELYEVEKILGTSKTNVIYNMKIPL